jgi:DNA-binding NarL/FixJ family response regulator
MQALELDNKLTIASCLEGLAGVLLAQGEPTRAIRIWGTAEALREAIGAPLPPIECAGYEQAVANAHSLLGEQVFAAAWAQGRTMTPEQALAMHEPAAIPGEMSKVPPAITSAAPAPSNPTGLTTREVEVLRLVAQGLSNAQIAEQLTISLYTVNAHVRSIYSKLEVTSRFAAMRFAAEHHLI